MSRITPPVTKFTHILRRSISSSASAGRPSGLLDSQARASRYLPRNIKDLKTECKVRGITQHGSKAELVDRLAAHDLVGSKAFHTTSGHRPIPVHTSQVYRTIPLMQGFQTSAPKQAARDTSTIDFFFFPEIAEPESANSFSKLRVPLLPDNYSPDRSPGSLNALETPDAALPKAEISVVAAHPELVMPASMSEVVGNDGLDVHIDALTQGFSSKVKELKEPGVLKELWGSLMDDVLGPKAKTA